VAGVAGAAEEEEAVGDNVERRLQVSQATNFRAFCSQVESLGVAGMRLNQTDRAGCSVQFERIPLADPGYGLIRIR
jgi:hypothetical protein